MPEAPEINVLVNQLKKILKNSYYKKYKIKNIYRFNKTINILLDNDKTIIIHLMLKGRLSLKKNGFTIHTLEFNNGDSSLNLYINDSIKLATVKIINTSKEQEINLSGFINYCQHHPNSSIMRNLQNFNLGVGKYLTKEIFGHLKITPKTKSYNFTIEEIKSIYNYTLHLITYITDKGGRNTFTDLYDNYGEYQTKY